MTHTGKLAAGAAFVASGIVLPIAFHFIGALGPVFLPMHIPVLMAGLFLGPRSGLFAGIITPVLSSVLTGMPPAIPTLPVMMAELAVYGTAGGYLYKSRRFSLLPALAGAMIAGRLAGMLAVYFLILLAEINLTPAAFLTGAVITGLPGIIIQLVVIPMLVSRLERVMSRNIE